MSLILAPAIPELTLAGATLLMVLLGAWRKANAHGAMYAIALLLLAGLIAWFAFIPPQTGLALGGGFVFDSLARYAKVLILIGSFASLLLAIPYFKAERVEVFEIPLLVMLATLGMMMMVSAKDLISLYIAIELQSLALYVLAAVQRDNVRSSEAGLKYFVLGALSSGMLLYGASMLYGASGSITFDGLAASIQASGASLQVTFGLVFLMAGLAFKVSAVPFHMWTPDVYEGAPTPITAFFAAAPKIAAMVMMVRLLREGLPAAEQAWQPIVHFISVASMVLAAVAAIGQNNIKRLLAYSSIGHMGYALLGLGSGIVSGLEGLLVYLALYVPMTVGSFAVIIALRDKDGEASSLSDLAGLSKTQPLLAFALATFLFSLAGIPPLAGFFAKFYVFFAAVEAKLFYLAVAGVLASVVSAFYYLRLVKIMYFDEPARSYEKGEASTRVLIIICVAITLMFMFVPSYLLNWAGQAASGLF
jgi:NADH-quinone oxidoreductase subunit N